MGERTSHEVCTLAALAVCSASPLHSTTFRPSAPGVRTLRRRELRRVEAEDGGVGVCSSFQRIGWPGRADATQLRRESWGESGCESERESERCRAEEMDRRRKAGGGGGGRQMWAR